MAINITTRAQNVLRIRDPHLGRKNFLRLDKNERTYPLPEYLVNEIRQNIDSATISSYPELTPLYIKLAQLNHLSPENIFLGSGSEQCSKAIFEIYLNPGDVVILPRPCYAMYSVYPTFYGASPVYCDYDNNFRLDLLAISKNFSVNSKIALVENPSGSVGSGFELEELRQFVKAAARAGVLVIIDEVYYPLHSISAAELINDFDNLIIVHSFSKVFGAAGSRIGYLVAQKQIIENIFKARPMYEISGLSAAVAEVLLSHPEEVDRYIKEINSSKNYLSAELNKRGIETRGTETNFILTRLRIDEAEVARFYDGGVLLKKTFQEGCMAGWSRLTVGSREQSVELIRIIDRVYGFH